MKFWWLLIVWANSWSPSRGRGWDIDCVAFATEIRVCAPLIKTPAGKINWAAAVPGLEAARKLHGIKGCRDNSSSNPHPPGSLPLPHPNYWYKITHLELTKTGKQTCLLSEQQNQTNPLSTWSIFYFSKLVYRNKTCWCFLALLIHHLPLLLFLFPLLLLLTRRTRFVWDALSTAPHGGHCETWLMLSHYDGSSSLSSPEERTASEGLTICTT